MVDRADNSKSDAPPVLKMEFRFAPAEAPVRLLRGTFRTFLEQADFADTEVEAVLLGLDEVLMNACSHGNGMGAEPVDLVVELFEDRLLMEVTDRGDGCEAGPANATLPNDEAESGRGMFLIHHTMDEVNFEPRQGGGTLVRLVKRR